MAKLVYGLSASLDGYIAAEGDDISWSDPDEELHRFWNDHARTVTTSLYGRKLYELMAAYWPTADEDPDASPVTVDFARVWRATPRIVFSRTLTEVSHNSRLERGDVVEVARRLKESTDGLIEVAGATLAAPLVRAGLVDEYLVVLHPVMVGGGTPLLPPLDSWANLRLLEHRAFPGGAVLLRYETR